MKPAAVPKLQTSQGEQFLPNPLLYLICQKQRKNRGVQIKKEDELCLTLNAGAPSSAIIDGSNEIYQCEP